MLLCEPSPSDPSTFLYTVMVMVDDFQARYEDGIDAKRIKYRKVKKPSFLVPLGKRCRRLSKNDVCYISDLKIKGKAGGIRIKILKNSKFVRNINKIN